MKTLFSLELCASRSLLTWAIFYSYPGNSSIQNLQFLSYLFIMMRILCTLSLLQIHIKNLHVQDLTPVVSNLCLSCNPNMRNLYIWKSTVCSHWIFSQKELLIEVFANQKPCSSFLEVKLGSSIKKNPENRWWTLKSHHVTSIWKLMYSYSLCCVHVVFYGPALRWGRLHVFLFMELPSLSETLMVWVEQKSSTLSSSMSHEPLALHD